MPVRKAIIPSLVYADAHRAIDFLGTAFGFERVMVVDGEPGQVAHAQLKLADNIVMLSSANPATRERYRVVSPGETGGLVTSGLYVTLDDPDAHHARASEAGAGSRGGATRQPIWRPQLRSARFGRIFLEFRKLRPLGTRLTWSANFVLK